MYRRAGGRGGGETKRGQSSFWMASASAVDTCGTAVRTVNLKAPAASFISLASARRSAQAARERVAAVSLDDYARTGLPAYRPKNVKRNRLGWLVQEGQDPQQVVQDRLAVALARLGEPSSLAHFAATAWGWALGWPCG